MTNPTVAEVWERFERDLAEVLLAKAHAAATAGAPVEHVGRALVLALGWFAEDAGVTRADMAAAVCRWATELADEEGDAAGAGAEHATRH